MDDISQGKSSDFYSSYDTRELVTAKKYKSIHFSYGDEGIECISMLRGGGTEKTKSVTYWCRIQATGIDGFKLADFLNWLAEEAVKQIEIGKGTVVRQDHKIGRRFHIEYSQDGFLGNLKVSGDVRESDQLSLEVESKETIMK